MAIPIKETPVLIGKDARKFEMWMKDNETKKVSAKEYERIKAAAKKFTVR